MPSSPVSIISGGAWPLVWFAVAAFIAASLTRWLIARFARRGIVAPVSARGMHAAPVPVGGGWAVVPLALAAGVAVALQERDGAWLAVAGGMALLAAISWVDDRRDLSGSVRLAAQAVAVAVVLALMPDHVVVLSEQWPQWVDRALTGLCWLWFINLFNFMDGIDGLAGVETLFIAAGLILIGLMAGRAPDMLPPAVLAGAVAGFLWHNWPPARIFLGDVGAIPIGFVLGWLLIQLAAQGHLAAAFLLPGYFLADASLTLLGRLLRGEAFWRPHRGHFYQRAARAAGGHAPVLWRVVAANAALLALAPASLRWPVAAALGGVAVVGALLVALRRMAAGQGGD